MLGRGEFYQMNRNGGNHRMMDVLSELEVCPYSGFEECGVRVWLKRDDHIHGGLSGNKFRKLRWNLRHIQQMGYRTIVTPGGAWSNHLLAVSLAGRQFGLRTIGLVRGEEPRNRNPILSRCVDNGMKVEWVDRQTYRNRTDPGVVGEWLLRIGGGAYWLPEGGSNKLSLLGAREIVDEIPISFDYLCVPCGTGGTMAGCIWGSLGRGYVIGFAAMRNGQFLRNEIISHLRSVDVSQTSWRLEERFHFGGYARWTNQLRDFQHRFAAETGFCPEWVYSAKALFGLETLCRERAIPEGSRVIYVVTQFHDHEGRWLQVE
jgi:1-aminocyclopropane-1-carboxylate deaminase/D-cysteine desulfhydrase-like pyridoxal-dependent ACC family enzyme